MITAKAAFGFDLFDKERSYDEPVDKLKNNNASYIIGGAYIAVGLPFGALRYRRTRAVLEQGVAVPFEVINLGRRRSNKQDIIIQYEIDGQTHKKKMSVAPTDAEGDFTLIVNPNKPTHVVIQNTKK